VIHGSHITNDAHSRNRNRAEVCDSENAEMLKCCNAETAGAIQPFSFSAFFS